MNEPNVPPTLPPSNQMPQGKRFGYKLLVVAVCIALLQIPLFLIESKHEERASRQENVIADITRSWGQSRKVHGPVLTVPLKLGQSKNAEPRLLNISPTQLEIVGDLRPEVLRRGIYRAEVYEADLGFRGEFELPPEVLAARDDFDWTACRVVFVFGDTAEISLSESLAWDGEKYEVTNVSGTGTGWCGVGAEVHIDPMAEHHTFSIGLAVKGSEKLSFAPLGRESSVSLISSASSPSFTGSILPDKRTVTPDGFDAQWTVGSLERSIPRYWYPERSGAVLNQAGGEDAFGVTLLAGVTDYRSVERALKYGMLFLLTVFTGCFLGEFLGGRPLNVLNYFLVGAALCLFFLALIALAELVGFRAAYALAALASTSLIVSYAKAVMREGRAVRALAMVLGGIFGYLFLVLRMEDLSLVAGTVLLFVLLGAVMFATRHLRFEDLATPKGAKE